MKIIDRLALLKAGYTKQDIADMIEEEKAIEEVEDKPNELPESYSDVLISLAQEVKDLKETMQESNRNAVDNIAPNHTVDEAMDILKGLINPIMDEKGTN